MLRPKELAALVPISLRLLRDAATNPAVEEVVRRDLAEIMALRQDLAFISGLGHAQGQPLGNLNHAGLTAGPDLGVNGATPTFDNLKAMLASVRAQNAPFARAGWLFNGRLLASLETVKDSAGRYLADAGLLTFNESGAGGTLLGYPFRTSSRKKHHQLSLLLLGSFVERVHRVRGTELSFPSQNARATAR